MSMITGSGMRGDLENFDILGLKTEKRKRKKPRVHKLTKLKLIISERHGEHVVSAEIIMRAHFPRSRYWIWGQKHSDM